MTFHSFYRRRRNNCLLNCRVDRKAAKFYKTLNLLRALYNKIREEEGSRVETGKGMCHRRASAAHNMCSLKLACSLELLWGCRVLKIKFFGSTLVLHSNVSSSYLVFEQSQKLIRRRVFHQKPDFNFLKTTPSSMYFWEIVTRLVEELKNRYPTNRTRNQIKFFIGPTSVARRVW